MKKMQYETFDKTKGFSGTCLECGSENVRIGIEYGFRGSDVTAADDPEIIVKCLGCNQQISAHNEI